MKLHLGCGEKYLDGYVNIDFPQSSHTVQRTSKADTYADILCLSYQKKSIEEIRLHHVFEHFPRPIAAALVAAWNSWLVDLGRLRIEVPDFERTARIVLSKFTRKKSKRTALRHLFGSHEAPWAVHYEGYTLDLMHELLDVFGFRIEKMQRNSWKGTHNIDVTAIKVHEVEEGTLRSRAGLYLKGFLVSETDEIPLLETWLSAFHLQYLKNKG